MPWPFDERLRTPFNAQVVEFLLHANPSAHDDVASALTGAARGLRGVRSYCPDLPRYAYVVLHTDAFAIFGLAYGMRELAFRVDRQALPRALADRGARAPDLGEGWVAFHPWPTDEATAATRERLRRWCAAACAYAHEVGGAAPSPRPP